MREREARCHLTLLIHVHVLAQSEQSVASSTPPLGLRLRAVYDEDGLDNDGDARPGLFTALQLCLDCLAFSVGLRFSHALGLPACVLRPGELVYAQGDIVVVTKGGASGEEGWSGYLEHNPGAGTGRFLRRYMEVVEDLSGDHYRTRCLVPLCWLQIIARVPALGSRYLFCRGYMTGQEDPVDSKEESRNEMIVWLRRLK